MVKIDQFYIDGKWVAPTGSRTMPIVNPATEESVGDLALGSKEDVDLAVAAAKRAFESFSQTSVSERLDLLQKLADRYEARSAEMADVITTEMGAPRALSEGSQTPVGLSHIQSIIAALKSYSFEQTTASGETMLREPIGVVGMITPWNWPMNQIALKVAPAIAAGCTMVLKPSEIAPLSGLLFAELMDEVGFPAGVFNLVSGEGTVVGEAMSAHPDIDMMTFTGSARAGTAVAKAAADTIKRVSQELGGKSPNLILDDADLEAAIKRGVLHCMNNTGQSCNAPTRMLVPRNRYDEAVEIATSIGARVEVGDPTEQGRHIGPLVSDVQFDKVQTLIQAGIDEGARLVAGGTGRPDGLDKGYYARPTIFADVNNDMTIAREEIFGPVLCMIPYDTEEEGIAIANDTPYGLAAYLQSGDSQRARRVAGRLRAGMVHINGVGQSAGMPFGGYKQSGNGREGGELGLEEFLEVKVVSGINAA
ncbi:MAG: aldehyde dehydrogenase family protein [Pseudomonadota bacterium]